MHLLSKATIAVATFGIVACADSSTEPRLAGYVVVPLGDMRGNVLKVTDENETFAFAWPDDAHPQGVSYRWRDGAREEMTGCDYPLDVTDGGRVLCQHGEFPNMRFAVWRNGTLTVLDDVPATACTPVALNDNGAVAYAHFMQSSIISCGAFVSAGIWHPDGRTTSITPPPGHFIGAFLDFGNDESMVVDNYDAILRSSDGRTWTQLYAHAPSVYHAYSDQVRAINHAGTIVGVTLGPYGSPTSGFWKAASDPTIRGIDGLPAAINKYDQVVGTYVGKAGGKQTPIDELVNDATWRLVEGVAISDNGSIVAKAVRRGTSDSSLVLLKRGLAALMTR